jgi:hypothetical protein
VRKQKAREALQEIDCPPQALLEEPAVPPASLVHLATTDREKIRSVPGLRIPSEKEMIKCKRLLATQNATETGTFANGAYLTDPVRFVTGLCLQSPLLVVGGDAGGGITKLGVTYSHQGKQRFAALVVFKGSDHYDDLDLLLAEGLTPFKGDSAAYPHIFGVLQHCIDSMKAFLNGDWPFINTVLGLKNASATHPCPICIVSDSDLLRAARYRTPKDQHSRNPEHQRLLTIDSERIVPTPLHLFLGISNRIILEVFSELLGKAFVEETLRAKAVATLHTPSGGGRADVHDLNGPEIRRWLKRDCCKTLLAAASAGQKPTAATKATFATLTGWLEKLHKYLLHKTEWEAEDIEAWRAAVTDIQKNWRAKTNSGAFPQLHMLRHALDFAERWRFLGRASEAQIESFHAKFNDLVHNHHHGMARDPPEQLRRSLADTALQAVQPTVLNPIPPLADPSKSL